MPRTRIGCVAVALLLLILVVPATATADGAWVKRGTSGQAYAWSPGSC